MQKVALVGVPKLGIPRGLTALKVGGNICSVTKLEGGKACVAQRPEMNEKMRKKAAVCALL